MFASPARRSFGWAATAALLLLLSASSATAGPAASVLAPTAFRPGVPGAVIIVNPGEAEYEASLRFDGSCDDGAADPCPPGPITSKAAGSADDPSLKLELSVPAEYPSGKYSLEVRSASDAAADPLLQETVDVAEEKPLMFVETDKPVYKPGATIMVRSVCLTQSLKPCTGQQAVRLVLKNPQGAKVLAVNAEEASGSGVFEGKLELDSRAPVGSWTVTAEGDDLAAELTVDVDEYVLPKFEVSLDVDQEYVTDQTREVTGRVSAVYSYGKGVDGTVVIRLSKDTPFWCKDERYLESKMEDPECKPLMSEVMETELGEDGSYSFAVPFLDVLKSWGGKLELQATVVETATGTEANATSALQLTRQPWHTIQVNSPETFYPGLPIEIEVVSEMSDGKPRDGKFEVKLEFSEYQGEAHLEVTETVEITGGRGTVKLQAPKQSACCLDKAADIDSFSWENVDCCWGTVHPVATMVDDNGKQVQNTWPSTGNCMMPAFPPSNSYITAERGPDDTSDDANPMVSVEVTATGDITSTPILYIVTSQGSFVDSATVSWDRISYDANAEVSTGSFRISKSPAMIPEAHLVVAYYAENGFLTAKELVLQLDTPEDLALMQSAPVNIKAEPSVPRSSPRSYYEPGEEVVVNLEAEPSSVVFVGGVDRSVSFLSSKDSRLSAARLLDAFKADVGYVNPGPMPFPCDAWRALATAGLSIATQADVPDVCILPAANKQEDLRFGSTPTVTGPTCYYGWGGMFRGDMMENEMAMPMMGAVAEDAVALDDAPMASNKVADSSGATAAKMKVRTKFPETWIWRSAKVDATTGEYSFISEAPDSITTWDLSGFSVSAEKGLGLSDSAAPAEVRVFKPLFVDLKLPYKVVRGERLEVVASVFNYLAEDQEVQLTLVPAAGQTGVVVPEDLQVQTLTVEANGAASFRAMLEFESLGTASLVLTGSSTAGHSDSVRRSLKVVPEGFKQHKTVNIMLEPPASGKTQKEIIPVKVDDVFNLVPGSEYASLTLAGELLGPTLEGLGSLVQLPMGCGEQNMLLMAPTVYVMRYLNSRDETRPELRSKALRFIEVGYSRELEYRHPDGSFSAFGTSDESGSTWLTAFVLKVFSQAHADDLVEVGADIASSAANWLVEQQDSEGQFLPRGRVIHSELVGGVVEGKASVSLTSFVTGALLEATAAGLAPSAAKASLAKALSYLIKAKTDTNYAKVLVAHNLALANKLQTEGKLPAVTGLAQAAETALDEMLSIGIREGTTLHWAPNESGNDSPGIVPLVECRNCNVAHATSPEIEMTGYALSALVTALGSEALADGFGVAKWLLGERTPSGGWSSTQDTVVALEGLSSYAAISSASPPIMTVTVRYKEAQGSMKVEKEMKIDSSNYDILQRIDLPVGKNVEVTIEGSGKAIMTIGTVWNTKAEPSEPTFLVSAMGIQEPGSSSMLQKVAVKRISGSGDSGMVIVNMQMFSGMVPDDKRLQNLKNSKAVCNGSVKRVEYADDAVNVYIDKIAEGDDLCVLDVELKRELVVENLQPVGVTCREYYNLQRMGAATISPKFGEKMEDFEEVMTMSLSAASRVAGVSPVVIVATALALAMLFLAA